MCAACMLKNCWAGLKHNYFVPNFSRNTVDLVQYGVSNASSIILRGILNIENTLC